MGRPGRLPGVGYQADDELVRQVAATCSSEALAWLYERHGPAIFRVAHSVSRDHGVAEEVVQETFLALWRRPELFEPARGSLATWLSTIARNRARDRLRATARRLRAAPFSVLTADRQDPESTVEWLVASGHLVGAGAPEPEPEEALTRSEAGASVTTALTELTAPERQAILLAYRDGLTQPEIAARLGWPLGTVKTRSRRALRRLRATLERAAAAAAAPSLSRGAKQLALPRPAPIQGCSAAC